MLDLFAEYLTDSQLRVEIGGHTDDVGSDTENLNLSQARSQAVRRHLIQAGVAPERIEAKGYGERKPRADNTKPEGRAKNRRTEFKVLRN